MNTVYRRVDEDRVIREWLRLERRKGEIDASIDVIRLSPDERLETLRHLWSPPRWGPDGPSRVWYQVDLTEHLLRSVRHAWGVFGIPGTVLDLARAIHRTSPEPKWQEVLAEHAELVSTVEAIAEELPETPDGKLILEAGLHHPPMLIDGNHRATALALHLLRTGEFTPIEVYIGFPERVVLSSVISRALMQVCRFRHF